MAREREASQSFIPCGHREKERIEGERVTLSRRMQEERERMRGCVGVMACERESFFFGGG
jgi:hypothetical protein